jgi:hypothetical protein
MSAISEILSIALQHLRAERLDTAISICRQIIEADSSQTGTMVGGVWLTSTEGTD